MESAGNDDGGLARRHVLRTPFSTSLECSKITFALNSARKQTTAIFARIAPASRFLLSLPVRTSPPFVVHHPSARSCAAEKERDRSTLSAIVPSPDPLPFQGRLFRSVVTFAARWPFGDLRERMGDAVGLYATVVKLVLSAYSKVAKNKLRVIKHHYILPYSVCSLFTRVYAVRGFIMTNRTKDCKV